MTGRHHDAVETILTTAPVIPVLIIEDVASAVPLARALVAGGLKVLEITLRTPAALDATRAILGEVEGAIVGVGTVLTKDQLAAAEKAGARFAVSPGVTEKLLDAADESAVPLLPGAASASESMRLLERGYLFQKFFPAEQAGGAAYVGALASPLAQIRFCPTGGITPAIAPNYLKLKNVVCVGGSWMAPKDKIAAGDWAGLEALAAEAVAIRG
ncbi:bifunctional 4-hydroxy-2-oxoglutarate aldolase/2-dehydro-3-deoxy-phosphogluconate aldolase [Segnochrobactrum spirostomi]|uniref:2-dehydro-3-deoxy-phosphogluconate aldolase n=1 Tax=Segnochrobactrum spirostomi TaxID=2608987 RepID=A0A6A7XYP0_9HYPH|nr:bifunctional 4-hydroxy-2-oxoglutarate aldolase/2-dehydro-3-deoxy-phosphogluconate aldolase [Segnochrobactrum spirostomi]MQT11416.1 bifunctional 4-hydroxy-2-oxoglutarate aldolase/2-dehydro-3-deoxy-phosphogluconate aldolase [Segnochrobactrum spirostomi]